MGPPVLLQLRFVLTPLLFDLLLLAAFSLERFNLTRGRVANRSYQVGYHFPVRSRIKHFLARKHLAGIEGVVVAYVGQRGVE